MYSRSPGFAVTRCTLYFTFTFFFFFFMHFYCFMHIEVCVCDLCFTRLQNKFHLRNDKVEADILFLSQFFFLTLLRTSTLSVTFSISLLSSSPVVVKQSSSFSTKPVQDSMDVALNWPVLSLWTK